MDDLRPYATTREAEFLDAIEQYGSQRAAAKALGISHPAIVKSLARLRQRAAQGQLPMEQTQVRRHCPNCHGEMTRKGFAESGAQRWHCHSCGLRTTRALDVSEPYKLKGTSTLEDPKTGEERLRWVKRDVDQEKREQLFREMAEAFKEEIPKESPTPPPPSSNDDLLTAYIISDLHIGQLSWPEETQEPWDSEIAERTLTRWFQEAIRSSPDSRTGLLIQLGDFLDIDSMEPVTPTHGHILDTDTRYPYLVRVAIRSMRRVVRMMLEKHQHVHIWACDANHDPTAGIWIREWMAALYEDEPRVTVDTSPESYNAYQFGNVGIYSHHGHKRKPADISQVIASRFREIYGQTKYSYIHMGHKHHTDVKEGEIALVEQHQTLSAPSDYSSRLGFGAGRSAQAITYHRDYGEVGRVRITPEMLGGGEDDPSG